MSPRRGLGEEERGRGALGGEGVGEVRRRGEERTRGNTREENEKRERITEYMERSRGEMKRGEEEGSPRRGLGEREISRGGLGEREKCAGWRGGDGRVGHVRGWRM